MNKDELKKIEDKKMTLPRSIGKSKRENVERRAIENLNIANRKSEEFLFSNYEDLNSLHTSLEFLIRAVNSLYLVNKPKRKSITILGITFAIEY